jgi:hypothetical protein
LHLIQPAARISGRIAGHRALGRSRPRRFAIPLPRGLKVWAETWRSREERLSELEAGLCARGAIVSRGGAFDRWDLQVRHTFIGAVRIRLGIEEHGAGRQLVRVQLAPCYARDVLGLVAVLAGVALVALLDGAQLAAAALGIAAVALGLCALRSAGLAMGSVLHASQSGDLPTRREVANLKLETT